MDPATLISIGLQILSEVLGVLKKSPVTTLTAEQIANAEAGIIAFQKVHNTLVTKAQVDSLRG